MMTEIYTIKCGQKDVLPSRADIKKKKKKVVDALESSKCWEPLLTINIACHISCKASQLGPA